MWRCADAACALTRCAGVSRAPPGRAQKEKDKKRDKEHRHKSSGGGGEGGSAHKRRDSSS
jgi:hypothetical protein